MLALLLAVASFGGWVIDNEPLKTFGIPGFPIRPWASVGYAFLAVATIASLLEKRRLAVMLAAFPCLIATWTMLRYMGVIQIEFPHPFFPDQLARTGLPNPGLPSIGAALSFLLLSLSIMLAPRRLRRVDDISILLAGTALLVAVTGSVIILFAPLQAGASPEFLSSLPASLIGMAIALAAILPRSTLGWAALLSGGGDEWGSFRRAIPAILILPIVPSLAAAWIVRHRLLPEAGADIAVVAGNILIVGGLIAWATSRVLQQQSELSYLARALDTSNVALVTPNGVIAHWSVGCERLYGYSRQEAVGRRKYELLQSRCSDFGAPFLSLMGADYEQDLVEVRRDGAKVCVIEQQQPADMADREPMIILTLLDITERIDAEAALRSSEQRLALAMAAHEVGVFEWDVTTGVIDWSPGAEQRLGFESGTMRDLESWRALIEPEDEQRVLDSMTHAIASRAEKFSFRYRLRPVDGFSRSIEGSSKCIYDDAGNLIRTVGVCLETTEREARETALRAREAQLRSILETVPEAMVVIDEHGDIQSFSSAAERMWGYRADEVLGRNFRMLATEEEGQRYATALSNYIDTGQTTAIGRTVPGTGLTADGRVFPAEIQVGVSRSGGELRVTMFFTDISERLVTEERMSDLNNELAHMSRQGAMSELAADLAHELNQPLAAVSNLIATARMMTERGDDPAGIIDLLKMGGEQTLRAGEIIRRLRAFMAKRDVDMRAEPLADLIRDTVDLVMVGTRPFDIRLDFDFDPAAPRVFADRVQVQQVLVNLLRNAIDALRDQPRAKRFISIVSRRVDDGMVEIEMSDNGPGIPKEILDNLYERFSTTKPDSGMGIGLSISRRIIEAHGGTLAGKNRPGGGATFRFTLPIPEELSGEEG
ncbi:MAG: PAS domain S-box protein [Sphingomonas sp.]|uniref:PAS domain S-box protein n=1 Tax=Sphingomonas sp. TaxID=28214 RepID=UPI00356457A8